MFRKLTAITLFISFIAMSTSGLMMYVIEKPSFTLQMHPIHKNFGLIMIAAVIAHLWFNYKSLLAYFKNQSTYAYTAVLVVLFVVLYGMAINNKVPLALAEPMDKLAEQAEGHE